MSIKDSMIFSIAIGLSPSIYSTLGENVWDDSIATGDTGWTYNGDGTWTGSAVSGKDIYILNLGDVGSTYIFEYEILTRTAGNVRGKLRGTTIGEDNTEPGIYTVEITDTQGFSRTGMNGASSFTGTIKIHSLREKVEVTRPSGEVPIVSGIAYYVDATGGNDSNSGTSEGSAWATINKVNTSSFSPGDGIFFKRGETWNEQLVVPSSGDASDYLTFGAYGVGDKPLIDGTGIITMDTYHGLITCSSKSYIKIESIEVKNSGIGLVNNNAGILLSSSNNCIVQYCKTSYTEGAGIKTNGGDNVSFINNDVSQACNDSTEESISLRDGSNLYVAHCNVYDDATGAITGGLGIDFKTGCHDCVAEYNTLTNLNPNALYVDGGLSLGTTNITFRYNLVYDTPGVGIMIASEGDGNVDNVLVHHNVFVRCALGGIVFHNKYDTGGYITNVKVYNNIVYQCGTNGTNYLGGVRVFDPLMKSLAFKNNILSENWNFQFGVDQRVGYVEDIPDGQSPWAADEIWIMDKNLIDGVNTGTVGNFTAYNTLGSGSETYETGDPLFVDPTNMDFRLGSGSPALDEGDASVYTGIADVESYNGTTITNGSGVLQVSDVNIGAYE